MNRKKRIEGYKSATKIKLTGLKPLDLYMKMTGQDHRDAAGGMHDYGLDKIIQLVKKCLKERKMIIWKNDPYICDGTSHKLINVPRRRKK